jgi:hypothetical protein
MPFTVERMRKGSLDGASPEETADFWRQIADLRKSTSAATMALGKAIDRVDAMKVALSLTPAAPGDLDAQLYELKQSLLDLDEQLNGNRSKQSVGEKSPPTINQRLNFAAGATRNSTYGPTPNIRHSFEIAQKQFVEIKAVLEDILDRRMPVVEKALREAGAPWMEGQPIPED